MADIFISYSRRDSEQATALAERLRASGASVWMDSSALAAAETWSAEIVNAIDNARLFFILLSPSAVASHNVNKELSLASEKRKTIVPIVIEKCPLSQSMEYALAGLQHVAISNEEAMERAFAKLGIIGSGFSQQVTLSARAKQETPKKKNRVMILSVAFIVLAACACFLFIVKKQAAASLVPKTIIVLPFESLSTDKENDYFADGLTGSLIDMLVPIQNLHVIDRNTSMEFKSSKKDVKSIASSLGCRYVVTGTFQRQGDQVMISVQMTDAETGSVLFSKSFSGKTTDLMQMQQQMAQKIVVELQLTLKSGDVFMPVGGKPSSPEAWDLCMKADYAEDHGKIDSSIALYLSATKFDPQYAYPYLSVAREYGNKYIGDTNHTGYLALADSFFTIGKRLDTAQQYSHYVASWIATVHHDYDQAITEASIYLTKQPARSGGYYLLALAYTLAKQPGLAADNFIEDLKRDPTDVQEWFQMLLDLWMAKDTLRLRQYSTEAIPIYQAYLERHPDDKSVRNNSIPLALVWSGRGDEACQRMEALIKTPNVDSQYFLNTAAINALSGKLDRAMELMRERVARSGVQSVDFERGFFDNIRNLPEFQVWVKQKEAISKKHV